MRRLNNLHCRKLLARSGFFALLWCPLLILGAQTPQPAPPHTPPAGKKGREGVIIVEVNEVVLHATVFDKKGRIMNDLK